MDTKLISVAVIAALAGIIIAMGFQLYAAPKTTGYATANDNAAANDNQGFSSYEEMMAAHHGGASAADSGCGMESGPSQSAFATGELTGYGVTLDNKGYQQLLEYSKISLDSAQQKKIVGLDIEMPCCGFQKIQATGNCECGHHVALVGLAKLLASKGYESDAIQKELDVWKNIFYPNGVDSGAGACG